MHGKAAVRSGLFVAPCDVAERAAERKMTNKILLNNVDHHDLRLIPRHGAEHGDSVNQLLVFPTEYEEIQREYPIFFRKDAKGDFQSVALLGLDRDENLFLEGDHWQARYVPAIQARGPFSIVLQEQSLHGERREPMIHVDLDDPRVDRDEGEPLFLPHGGNSPYLENIAGVLRRIFTGLEMARLMFASFDQLGLIQPVAVEIKLSETRQYNLPNLYTIEQDRLGALDGAALERLHGAGYLRLAFLAAASLGNVARLIELKNRKGAGR